MNSEHLVEVRRVVRALLARFGGVSAHLRASVGDGGCGGEEPQLIISVRLYENDF